MLTINEEQLNLFILLFRGRQEVYARYWEKDGRSGYSPAYEFNWYEFLKFKSQGGTLKDFQNKKLAPLTPVVVKKHLTGVQTIGIYPILPDSTSYFIAADFDGENWQRDSKIFVNECANFTLNAYMEISRSGNGCHAWIFFEEPYPCDKSRQIVLELIRKALKLSEFDKEVSFDRLFPNQDTLSKKGFGNLIALPFQGKNTREDKTVFIDPASLKPYCEQWKFLCEIKKHSALELDAIHDKLFKKTGSAVVGNFPKEQFGQLQIIINNKLILKHSQLSSQLISFLKEKLNFINTEYLVKQRLGKSIYRVKKFFKLIEEREGNVFLPRGFLNQIKSFLETNHISYQLIDERPQIFCQQNFTNQIKLLPEQAKIVEQVMAHDSGVIIAPAGSGKTIIGLELIARRSLPALILVHRKQLLNQWTERIESFLGIPKAHIGQFSGIKKKQGQKVTIAMLQSLARIENLPELKNEFGTVIVDECHHIPAVTFREIISKLNPRYLYGLTATPKRKHNDEPLIYMFIGDIIAEMKASSALIETADAPAATEIIIRETNLSVPFKYSTDSFQILSKIICFDTARNQLIVKDIIEQVSQDKKILLLSECHDHLEVLSLYLKGLCETIVISGEDSEAKRRIKLKQIESGHYQIILSTGQFFGEGLDIHNIDCLIFVFPFSFEGKLIQYIGRLRGRENKKVIIDYRDKLVPFLDKQFKQRKKYYNKLVKSFKLIAY